MPDPRSPEERLKRRKKAAKAAFAGVKKYPVDSLTEAEKGYLKALQEPVDVMPPDKKREEERLEAVKVYLQKVATLKRDET
jgi:hypothetical protein